ncbi:hypothetical protein B0T17DRAFT_591184 [Bombardia bombarda]|uniref:Zn(2)-C6 fungal-type domain-containing protein n=1 Tax=Bombardia bombarda TaxID=252184 RepID=A0AA40C196_9PEZI|nr:hypothetical protein B0T17DRAFT_591184 [Bombardia bombarda]
MDSQSSISPPSSVSVGQPAPERTVEPPRIRRNTACVRCRDAKVKCNASLVPNQPCQRCSKLEFMCVVDKSHKRTSRRSKLEELAAEVQTIKEAVAPRPASIPNKTADLPPPIPSLPPAQLPSPHIATPSLADTFINGPPNPFGRSRALGSRVFSGGDISFYFEKYFEHFHPYLPIVRMRDPDACYKRGPVLFWTIIMTACRRYARDSTVYQFLQDKILPEIWGQVSQPPLRLPTINALLLLATWPFPTIRFLSDPSLVFVGIALNSAFLSGLHTGYGSHPEFKALFHTFDTTDEEACFTWAACAIVSHRVSAYMGCPSTSSPYNQTIDKLLDGSGAYPVTRYFAVHLETARFANKVSRTMCASLEEAKGVSHHLVGQMEDEFSRVQGLLYIQHSDLDSFTVLSTLMEIQTYYFMPLPGYSQEMLKRNVIKCYTTAETLINHSTRLDENFLLNAPHFVFRTFLSAVCVIMSVHLSSYTTGFQADTVDSLVRLGFRQMRLSTFQDGDLYMRVTNMLEKYWDLRSHIPKVDVSDLCVSVFTNRLGASLTFDCLRRWKQHVEQARDASTPVPSSQLAGEPLQDGSRAGPNADLGLADAFQRMDWNAFIYDFDWSFTPNYLGAP